MALIVALFFSILSSVASTTSTGEICREIMHHAHHHRHLDNEGRVFWAMCLTATFTIVEVAGGLISGSLALLADAGHMLTDTAALAFAWMAFRVGRKPPDRKRSYGYHRFQILAAFLNGMALVVVVAWILFEALERLREPVEIQGWLMFAVAAVGLLVNVVALLLLLSTAARTLLPATQRTPSPKGSAV